MINVNENIAVVSSGPLHHALKMMIVSQRLMTEGRKNVTTFSPSLKNISPWFCIHQFCQMPSIQEIPQTFRPFQSIILLYKDTPFCNKLIQTFRNKSSSTKLFILYSHEPANMKLTDPKDFIFNSNFTMVDNIASHISKILFTKHHSKSNGICAPLSLNLTHRKHAKRVLIQTNQYSYKKLISLSHEIKKLGFTPHVYSKQSTPETLCLIYESGYFIGSNESRLSTLASNLYIPSLLLKKGSASKLKTAGWLKQTILTPPFFLRPFILPFTKKAAQAFKGLVLNHHELIT